MASYHDITHASRNTVLTLFRLSIKGLFIFTAIFLHAQYQEIIVITVLVLVTELYKLIANQYIHLHPHEEKHVGALISALDGGFIIFALYLAGLINTDYYLYVLFSIVLNTAEYGLLSAIVEGIVAGFSYAVFILASLTSFNSTLFFSDYMIRIIFIVFLGWITGYLSTQLKSQSNTLSTAVELDIEDNELNEIRTHFVTNAAEDIKAPLNAVKGYADILLHGRAGKIDVKAQEYVTNITQNAKLIDKRVEELLHLLELDDRAVTPIKKQIFVKDLANVLMQDAEAFAHIHKSTIIINRGYTNKAKIVADTYRLKIAIKNILGYVFDLAGKNVTLTFQEDTNNVSIIIRATVDNVVGLDGFIHEINDSDTENRNSYLKIYTAKLILKSNNGSMHIEKKDENDVIVTIYLPTIF